MQGLGIGSQRLNLRFEPVISPLAAAAESAGSGERSSSSADGGVVAHGAKSESTGAVAAVGRWLEMCIGVGGGGRGRMRRKDTGTAAASTANSKQVKDDVASVDLVLFCENDLLGSHARRVLLELMESLKPSRTWRIADHFLVDAFARLAMDEKVLAECGEGYTWEAHTCASVIMSRGGGGGTGDGDDDAVKYAEGGEESGQKGLRMLLVLAASANGRCFKLILARENVASGLWRTASDWDASRRAVQRAHARELAAVRSNKSLGVEAATARAAAVFAARDRKLARIAADERNFTLDARVFITGAAPRIPAIALGSLFEISWGALAAPTLKLVFADPTTGGSGEGAGEGNSPVATAGSPMVGRFSPHSRRVATSEQKRMRARERAARKQVVLQFASHGMRELWRSELERALATAALRTVSIRHAAR